MKKTTLLNAELSTLIATLGHGDMLVIGDAGLPIPAGVQRIDLALMPGIPAIRDVLYAVLSEMQVERAVIALEAQQAAAGELPAWCQQLQPNPVTAVTHAELKAMTGNARAVVRTGECTPYANIILCAGVVF
jgi:D-ribose pyranase